jgi:hypothetical protein
MFIQGLIVDDAKISSNAIRDPRSESLWDLTCDHALYRRRVHVELS